jgi:hypothetical protein
MASPINTEDDMSPRPFKFARIGRWLLLAILLPVVACHEAPKPAPQAFASPDDAASAVVAAIRAGDQAQLLTIFGPEAKDLISSGDSVQDKNTGAAFVAGYDVMHRWRKLDDSSQMLVVGATNFGFAIPLKKNANGQWFFDTAAGHDEVLNRRVGRNELAVIDICQAAADAQQEYYSQPRDGDTTRQFAQKFISDPGKQNGLYWPSADGQPQSPLGPLFAFATAEGYSQKADQHVPFHGYYFRLLQGQGSAAQGGATDYMVNGKMVNGFAFVAYPAEYGNSGVMSFMINQDGLLLEKDLGKSTTETATAMTQFNPDAGWKPVEE